MKCCLPTLLCQVLAVTTALGSLNPEPWDFQTTVVKILPLGNRGVRPREKVSAAGQSRGGLLPAERGAASPCVRPCLALSTSLGAWEAGLCALSPSGDQEPTDHSPRLERKQQPPRRQGFPRVMLPLAPGNAHPNPMVGSGSKFNGHVWAPLPHPHPTPQGGSPPPFH